MKVQARSIKDLPPKPGYLTAYEMIPESRRPIIVSGELMDQPHLWLLEYEAIDQTVKLFQAMDNRNNQGRSNAAS